MSVTFCYPLTLSFPLNLSPSLLQRFSSACPNVQFPSCLLHLCQPQSFSSFPIQTTYATFPLLLSFAPSVSRPTFLSYLLNSPCSPYRYLYCRHMYLPIPPNEVFCFFSLLHINHSLSYTFPPLPLSFLIGKKTSFLSTLVGIFLKVKLLWHFYSVSSSLTLPRWLSHPTLPPSPLPRLHKQHSSLQHPYTRPHTQRTNSAYVADTCTPFSALIWWLNHLITIQRTGKGKWQNKIK